MNNIEAYSYLFSDSLFSNLITNLYGELVIDVMLILGTYNKVLILFLSSLGSFTASLINWVLGKIIRTAKKADEAIIRSYNYNSINNILSIISPIILFFSFIPTLGALFLLALGLFKIRLTFTSICVILLGKLVYYASKIYF